jgi:hypothetical protein
MLLAGSYGKWIIVNGLTLFNLLEKGSLSNSYGLEGSVRADVMVIDCESGK